MTELIPVEEALEHAQALNAIRPTGLVLPERMTRKDYYSLAVLIGIMQDSNGYARADLAYRARLDFPDDEQYKMALAELATMWGKMPGTIANDAKVGEVYTHEERQYWMDEGVKYSALRICAPLPKDKRDEYLKECASGMTIFQLTKKLFGKSLPPPTAQQPSRDVRRQYSEWLETLAEADREYARYYVSLFVEYLETS